MTTTTFLYLSYIYEEPDWGAQDVFGFVSFFLCVSARAREFCLEERRGVLFIFHYKSFEVCIFGQADPS